MTSFVTVPCGLVVILVSVMTYLATMLASPDVDLFIDFDVDDLTVFACFFTAVGLSLVVKSLLALRVA